MIPKSRMWVIFFAAIGFGLALGFLFYLAFFSGVAHDLAHEPLLGAIIAAVLGMLIGFSYYLFFKSALRSFTWPYLRRAQGLVVRPIEPLRPIWSSTELDKLDEILNEALATLERLDLFSNIAKEIVAALDQQKTLGHIVGTAVETLPADSGLVFLLDEKSGRYTVRVTYLLPGLDGQEDRVSFAAGEGVPGWVATEGDALIIADAQRDERVHSLLRQQGVRSLLSAPLSVGGRTIGVLNLFNSERNDAFDENDLRLACVYADLAAVALDNARLFELSQTQATQARVLNQIARAVNANLDLEAILKIAAEEIAQLAPHIRASLGLPVDHDPDHLRVRPLTGRLDSELPDFRLTPIEGGGVGWAFVHGRPFVAPDLDQEQYFPLDAALRQAGIRSYVCLPLVQAGQPVGVLNLGSDQPQAYGEHNLPLLEQVGEQLATAIRNARLYELSQRRVAELDMLNDVGRALSGTLEVDDLMEIIYRQTQRVLDADNLYIALYDEVEDQVEFAFLMHQGERRPPARRQAGAGLTEYVIRTRQPLFLCGDVTAQAEALGMAPLGSESKIWLGVPLIYGQRVLGMLSVQHYEDAGAYDETDLRLLQSVANQAAIALHNAHLYKEAADEQRKLAAVLNDTDDVIVVLDEEERLLILNPAAEEALQAPAEKVVGRPLAALEVGDLEAALEAARSAQAPVVREIALPGERTLYASVSPVHDVGWVLVMQDISHLKELDQLRTEWVAAVSHDLKNPITTVQLSAMLLEKAGSLNEKQRELVATLQRGSERLRSLVTDVLDLARLEAGPVLRPSAVDPNDVVARAMAEVEALAADKNLSLSVELPPGLPPVRSDAALLTRVMVNLFSNAIKYTPSGGQVRVRVRPQSGVLCFEVSDTGCGIPAEALPHLFDRFYRVPGSEGEGSGLGLSIVESIVEKHGGRIWVESELGAGSTFAFTVPTWSPRKVA